MPERQLASEPVSAWHKQGKPHSHAALEWLTYQNRKPHVNIRHARNGGEHVILQGAKTYHVDGYDANTHTVYEFNGCFWHGCPRCFPDRDKTRHKMHDQTMPDVHEATILKQDALFAEGYSVIVMWECEWTKLKQEDETVRQLVQSFELVPRLQPRDAFFGGRTNAIKLHHVVQDDEKIYYLDFTSLYPWTNKNCFYPVGHPVVIHEPGTTDITPYFGLVKCKILPPYGLYHPVLPYRSGGKLTFPLCRTCVEQEPKPLTERSNRCRHTDAQRCLVDTWLTPEVQEAINRGYRIQHMYEVWHFTRNSNSMFSSYVDTFLKIKQEASGWPEWVGDDVDKRRQYLDDYRAKEGITLDPDKIDKNPGRRSPVKMMLNSFWGKYGQQRKQESSRDHFVARTTPQIVERRQSGTPNLTRHERRDDRSRLQARGRGRDGPGQHQHIRGLFHHLLGLTQTLPGRTESTPAPTSPLLRYRFHHLLASTRATHATLGRSSRRIHQRIETRRPYRGICCRKTKSNARYAGSPSTPVDKTN